MGIIASKGNNKTMLINLCKERKKLIRATRDVRYHLAKSHLHYFKSLLGFSNALNQFVNNDLIVIPYSDDDDSSSSELICCESDSDSDSDSDSSVCDLSQPAPLSNNDDLNTQTFRFGDGTWGSSNSYQEDDMEKSREGFEEILFASNPTETEMRGSQNFSSIQENHDPIDDIFGFYDSLYNTHWGNIEPDQRDDEVESDGFREVREREGIPDLEPESDHNSLIRKKQKKKKKRKNVEERSSVAGEIDKTDVEAINTCNGQASGQIDKIDVETNTCNSQVSGEVDSSSETCGEETQKTPEIVIEGVVTTSGEEICDEGYETPSSSFSELSDSSGLNDLRNVVERINSICEKVVSYSEVCELLEVTRVAYHRSLGSQFMKFASRVLGSSRNRYRIFRLYHLEGSLSMTLEKLFMSEKKLYEEVKVEEKLRVSYEKVYKILKELDNIGAESDEIHEAQTLVKLLLSRIHVSIRAIESISMRIHKIRDEELWFQVIEIIIGFKKMWRFLAKCHHKQFQVISKSNSCLHIVEKGSKKATKKVEKQIRSYGESLKGYIDAERSFVRLLNEWLNRNIMEEDETEIEAPEIFRVSREWLKEIENVDETKVLSAVEEMRLRFQGLGLNQAEEKKQRKRIERLSKELARKTKEQEEIWGTAAIVPTSNSGPTETMMVEPELLALRETVAQETTKHESVIRELNDTVSETLQECLVVVFEALEDFCFANFKAYENIRIVPTETLLLSYSKE